MLLEQFGNSVSAGTRRRRINEILLLRANNTEPGHAG